METERSKQLVPPETLEKRETFIAPTARVEPGASIGRGVFIGDWCVISAGVVIGDRTTLKQNVIIEGCTEIGEGSVIHQFCTIGNQSHDLKFSDSEKTKTTIGRDVVIREFTNVHAGTPLGRRGTFIGERAYIMSHSHIGHDCEVLAGAVLSQGTTLGGEVVIGENSVIGGCTAIHQLCTIGKYAIIGGCSKITMDVIPFAMSDGNPQELDGLNLVGLRRHGFSVDDVRIIKEVYKTLFISDDMVWEERLAAAKKVYAGTPVADEIFHFIGEVSRRPLARPRKRFKGGADA
ncbi:MAG: acyl-ACP--UDP-N-acetylglucosamine O-acyltransferase [Rickettsiales bacterium]|jgi:UDP-N-acetylglucosamine acyltransferase|nr:acyl-ACP--UDP-N-acetylglucosamine O-acyltransferase [Rickettsiales bacterium]